MRHKQHLLLALDQTSCEDKEKEKEREKVRGEPENHETPVITVALPLIDKILHWLIGGFSQNLSFFFYLGRCRVLSINSIAMVTFVLEV